MVPSEHHLLLSGLLVLLTGSISYSFMSNNYRTLQTWLVLGTGTALVTAVMMTAANLQALTPIGAAGAGIIFLAFAYTGSRQLKRIQQKIERDGEVMING